jgi:hypothetical protein
MVFIQTLNKFHTTKDIEFINSIYNRPNDFTIPYLFCTNILVQKHNGNVFINTLGPTFIFKAMDINHQSYKFSNDLSKTAGFHFIINKKKCWLNYVLVTM